MSWFSKALVAIGFLTPVWLAIPAVKKVAGVSAGVFGVWYFPAVGLGMAVMMLAGGPIASGMIPPAGILALIVAMGLVTGAAGNLLLFEAVESAPNPGMAVSMTQLTALSVFFASIALARWWPDIFPKPEADWRAALGILMITAGVAVMKIR
jgi:hypothetical protein